MNALRIVRAPGEVDAFSSSGASEAHTLDRIESNFRAREPAPYLTEEEGRWLLDKAAEWKASAELTPRTVPWA